MRIKLLKEPATLLGSKYGCPYDDFVSEAIIDTQKNEVEFVWFNYDGQHTERKSYPLKSEDGFVIRDAAYYDDFSQQGL